MIDGNHGSCLALSVTSANGQQEFPGCKFPACLKTGAHGVDQGR